VENCYTLRLTPSTTPLTKPFWQAAATQCSLPANPISPHNLQPTAAIPADNLHQAQQLAAVQHTHSDVQLQSVKPLTYLVKLRATAAHHCNHWVTLEASCLPNTNHRSTRPPTHPPCNQFQVHPTTPLRCTLAYHATSIGYTGVANTVAATVISHSPWSTPPLQHENWPPLPTTSLPPISIPYDCPATPTDLPGNTIDINQVHPQRQQQKLPVCCADLKSTLCRCAATITAPLHANLSCAPPHRTSGAAMHLTPGLALCC
jgi:hypothetical protein